MVGVWKGLSFRVKRAVALTRVNSRARIGYRLKFWLRLSLELEIKIMVVLWSLFRAKLGWL